MVQRLQVGIMRLDYAMREDVLEVLRRSQQSILPLVEDKIALGCPILDSILHGGVRCGMITEVTGKYRHCYEEGCP